MDKQRPINKVAHNDAYSASLMEMYAQWMGGNCFQGSNIPEAFEGMDPQSHGAEVEDTTKKKKKIDKKEKSVAEETKCEKCGGAHPTEECPNVLESEEYEIDGDKYVIEKVKGLDGKACWKGYKYAGTKMKGGKKVDNCVKAGVEYDVDTANQLWSEVGEKLDILGEMDGVKFKVIGEKLDPVGKEDKDVDNDGDHDKSDKYLLARRKKVSKLIAMKKK